MRPALVPGLLSALAASVVAQSTVLVGTATHVASTLNPHLHNLATAYDGSMYTLAVFDDGLPSTNDALLQRSTDGGKTWTTAGTLPTTAQNGLGAIYIAEQQSSLHATWIDGLSNGLSNLLYQTFDTVAGAWIGSPTVIQMGTSSYIWFAHDVQVTRGGTVIVGASSGVGGGPGFSGQSTVLFVKPPGATAFGAPIQVNKSVTAVTDIGRAPSLHVEDEVVHVIYRTKRSQTAGIRWGFSYRSYDTVAGSFQQPSDVHIGPNDNATVDGGLLKATAMDRKGNFYCVHVSPDLLRMAYAPAGMAGTSAGWSDITITADSGLLGGNNPASAYTHFGITRGAQGYVHVVYSKLSESFQTLYVQTFKDGAPLIPAPASNERVLKSTTAGNSFLKVNGAADVRSASVGFALTSGTPPANPQGIIEFFNLEGSIARAVEFSSSCRGSLADAPRLWAKDAPLLGSQFDVVTDRMPATAPLLIGFCLPGPQRIELSFMGAPSCYLIQGSFLALVAAPAQPSGAFTLSAILPNNPALIGSGVFLQSAVTAPTANAAGLLTTNGLGVFF